MDRASLVVRPTRHSRPGRWAVRAVFGLAAFGDRLLPDLLSHHPGHLAVPTGSISLGDPALARPVLGRGIRGDLATLAPPPRRPTGLPAGCACGRRFPLSR